MGWSAVKRNKQRTNLFAAIGGALVVALVTTIAIVANGYEMRQTPPEAVSIWTWRDTGAGSQYARVNTVTGEIDTVRDVESPSGIVQYADDVALLAKGDREVWQVNTANPQNISDAASQASAAAAAAATSTDAAGTESGDAAAGEQGGSTQPAARPVAQQLPAGTKNVFVSGNWALVITESNEAFVADLSRGEIASALALAQKIDFTEVATESSNPESQSTAAVGDGEEAADADSAPGATVTITAGAIDERGRGVIYSAASNQVFRFDAKTMKVRQAAEETPRVQDATSSAQLALVDNNWAILTDNGQFLHQGSDRAITVKTGANPLLTASTAAAVPVAIADSDGLLLLADGEFNRQIEADGVPSRPRVVGERMFTAWAGPNGGTLWKADVGSVAQTTTSHPLQYPNSIGDLADPQLRILYNGNRAILSEASTGMLWTLPEGNMIPIEQWDLFDTPRDNTGTVVVSDVTEAEPPVAVADEFGVRASDSTQLQVLLNDHDPNKRDILTIDPASIGGLPENFGRIELLPDGQTLMFYPQPSATGSASFDYRITDGALSSNVASVTLTVAPENVNTAPEWCPVNGCQRTWPVAEITPGGTTVMSLLDAWVDPQGDPLVITAAAVADPDDPVRAVVSDDDRVAVQHTQPGVEGDYTVKLTVTDARGESTQRDLRVHAVADAQLRFEDAARTATVNRKSSFSPLSRVVGGSGSYSLISATSTVEWMKAEAKSTSETVDVIADRAGSGMVTVTVKDNVTEAEVTGNIRVTATDSEGALTLGPLRAFVRSGQDTTLDILSTLPGASNRTLTLSSAEATPAAGAQLYTDIVEYSKLRISGSASNGTFGRLGTVAVTVTEGDRSASGFVTVYQVPSGTPAAAIAVADGAKVRAGAVVDIPVLRNDIAPPGDRLVLNPEIVATESEGELAFASGSTLRYLAPKKPGIYKLRYTTSGASSPEHSDSADVIVTVVSPEGNQNPQPVAQVVRMAPGDKTTLNIPLSGIDPDGDRVRIVGVNSASNGDVTSVLTRNGIKLEAATSAKRGVVTLQYTVRDNLGGEGVAELRVVIVDRTSGAPIVYSDYIRATLGAKEPVTVRPLENDIDPRGGELELLSVEPQLQGGEEHPLYQPLKSKLDLKQRKDGTVKIAPIGDAGSVSFRYTVRSKESKSTSDGLIVVQTSNRVQTQAPVVTDTVLSVADRADLETSGIDVVTHNVRWASGDPSTLQLSMWGASAERYTTSGQKIKGKYRANGDVAVFKLSGVGAQGEPVETYGLMIVPPLDELRVTLAAGFNGLTVDENSTVSAPIDRVFAVGKTDKLEFAETKLQTVRSNASCEITGDQIRYTAGAGEPWQDRCLTRVRIAGQESYTAIAVPVTVHPDVPKAKLNNLTRTLAPGDTEDIKLTDMVSWEGNREGRVGDLRFVIGQGDSRIAVTQQGSTVRVSVAADAQPGSQLNIPVVVNDDATGQLIIRVGNAPESAPRGGTVTLKCTVDTPCTGKAIGIPGEYDPFAGSSGAGLELTGVSSGTCDAYGSFSVSGDRVVFTAKPNGAGGQCSAGFTVADAQDRTGSGTIELDLQGRPSAPTSISQVAYGPSNVVIGVELGGGRSYPEVNRVRITSDLGASANCTAVTAISYRCEVGGLENGVKHTFSAIASNSVGDSARSPEVVAWAYRAPNAPTLFTAKQVERAAESGRVEVHIEGGDDVDSYDLNIGGSVVRVSGPSYRGIHDVPVGLQQLTATPQSRFTAPQAAGGSASDNTATATVQVYGRITSLTATAVERDAAGTSATVTMQAVGGAGQTLRYGAAAAGECVASSTTPSVTVTGLDKYRDALISVCVTGSLPDGSGDTVAGEPILSPRAPVAAPQNISFRITPEEVTGSGFTLQARYSIIEGDHGCPGTLQYRAGSGNWGTKDQAQQAINGGNLLSLAVRCMVNEDAISDQIAVGATADSATVMYSLYIPEAVEAISSVDEIHTQSGVTIKPAAGVFRFSVNRGRLAVQVQGSDRVFVTHVEIRDPRQQTQTDNDPRQQPGTE